MRYLKITAQNLFGEQITNTVHLQFFEVTDDGYDNFSHKFSVYDVYPHDSGGALIDGFDSSVGMTKHQRRLVAFAQAYLHLNWFNPEHGWARYLKIYAKDTLKDGSPDSVHLLFYDGRTGRTVYTAEANDTNSDGKMDVFLHADMDNDGEINDKDRELVKFLSVEYLKLDWNDR